MYVNMCDMFTLCGIEQTFVPYLCDCETNSVTNIDIARHLDVRSFGLALALALALVFKLVRILVFTRFCGKNNKN